MEKTDTQPVDLATRKMMGKRFLDENRLEEAIQVFTQILREKPADLDSYLYLGDCYMIAGDAEMALMFYVQAKGISKENNQVERRIQLARLKKFVSYDGSENKEKITNWIKDQPTLPTQPQAVAEILQNLTDPSTAISEEDVLNAAKLLKEIIYSSHPALQVAERLDEINELIPALLELNIRQARADGRMDLVEGLQNLLENIQLQKQGQISQDNSMDRGGKSTISQRPIRLFYLDSNPHLLIMRSQVSLDQLAPNGIEVTLYDSKEEIKLDQFDVLFAVHPHLDSHVMEILAQAHAVKIPIIVYLEMDFEQMPINHPTFEVAGLGSAARAKAYTAACLLADLICVPSESFAKTLRQSGYTVEVIPPVWIPDSLSSTRPNQLRHTVNLGWIGFRDELEDVFQVKRMIVRVMREFPHTQLVIAGDVEIYQLFDSLPDARRLFIPILEEEDVGYALNQMDILIIPLRNNPFHYSFSDLRLVLAGERGIPWVASPLPEVVNWEKGGLMVNSVDEWHTYLRQLVLDDELRHTLGETGKRAAQLRSTAHQVVFLQKMLIKLVNQKKK